MIRSEIEAFEKVTAQVLGLHEELSAIARKKPDGPVSAFKLRFANNLIQQLHMLLGEKYRPFGDFDQFDADDVPTASDVTMILSQYLECAETMRSDNIILGGVWRWIVDDDPRNDNIIRTAAPKKIVRKQ